METQCYNRASVLFVSPQKFQRIYGSEEEDVENEVLDGGLVL